MAYLAFYRAFRPTTFDTVVRQEHIVRTLKNQIESDKIGHAYLFCGPRGTGKTSLAKIFARAINCQSPRDGSPCGECDTCRALAGGSALDIIEIDAASNNGVDEMRDLRENVQYPPVVGKYKVYIIDEVHMLTASAFNAVLKTLEEPPAHAVFILATTEPQKIPATISSRCMRFDFKLIPQKDLEDLIKSVLDRVGKQYEDEAVSAIARAGAGSARDSLSIADMCASYSTGKLTYADVNIVLGSADFSKIADLGEYILTENSAEALTCVEEILSTGKSVGVLVKDLLNFLNNCAVIKICKNPRPIVNLPEEVYLRIEGIAALADGHKILRVTEILAAAESDLRYSLNGRITLETAVIKCAMPETDYNLDAVLGKINAIEEKLKGNVFVQPRTAPQPEKKIEPAVETPRDVPPQTPPAEAQKPKLAEVAPEAENPFADVTQPDLFEDGKAAPPPREGLGEADKKAAFGKFIKCLRTTHKNAVLFTLCMDLENFFEGDKLVLLTSNEAVYKALVREENSKFIAEVLSTLGITEHEVRKKDKEKSKFDRAVEELKNNFDGVDIDIK